MNNNVNFAAVGWDDDMERYCVCWQTQALCFADAWHQFARDTRGAEDGEQILMIALDNHAIEHRRAVVETTITWEGP